MPSPIVYKCTVFENRPIDQSYKTRDHYLVRHTAARWLEIVVTNDVTVAIYAADGPASWMADMAANYDEDDWIGPIEILADLTQIGQVVAWL